MLLVPVSRPSAQTVRFFDEAFDRFFHGVTQSAPQARTPSLDVSESDTHYTAQLEVPGVAKEDVQISIEGRRVIVKAESKVEEKKADGTEAEKAAADRVIHRERSVSRYARVFTLPVEVTEDASAAKLDNGVLTLTLAKKRPAGAARIAVN